MKEQDLIKAYKRQFGVVNPDPFDPQIIRVKYYKVSPASDSLSRWASHLEETSGLEKDSFQIAWLDNMDFFIFQTPVSPSNIIRTGWFRVGYAFGYGPGREFESLEEAKNTSRYGGFAGIIRIDWLDNQEFIITRELY